MGHTVNILRTTILIHSCREIPIAVIASTDMQPSQSSPSANGLKRRQSEGELPEQESKRPRVSPGKSSPIPSTSETSDKRDTPTEVKTVEDKQGPREARKRSAVGDEKQRSKRLFGALLGNLNRPSDRVSKRRQEIESRRKAELQRQDDERLEDKQRRVEQLIQRRKKVQRKTDEQHVCSRQGGHDYWAWVLIRSPDAYTAPQYARCGQFLTDYRGTQAGGCNRR